METLMKSFRRLRKKAAGKTLGTRKVSLCRLHNRNSMMLMPNTLVSRVPVCWIYLFTARTPCGFGDVNVS